MPKPYPAHLLEGCESALLLFCAGFLGENDGDVVAAAGIGDVTGIDHNAGRIAEMREKYPAWTLVEGDAFEFALDQFEIPLMNFDLVSVDPDSGLDERVRAWLPAWCALARRVVVLGTVSDEPLDPPDGWEAEPPVRRNARARWLPYTRC